MPHTLTANLAANVRAEAARRRVSQAQIAQHLGLDRSAVSRRLSGKTEFSSSELARISDLLEVPVAELFGERS